MNLCTTCGQDFGSVSAFDLHRVGVHAYTFAEGMRAEPPREDGRRCLHVSELDTATDKLGAPVFARNVRGVWSIGRDLQRARGRSPERAAVSQARE